MSVYSGPGYVVYRGRPVLQSGSVSFQVATNNKDVDTLLLGRAGHSRGARKIQVQVENAIPLAGYEIDWAALANAQAEVALTFRIAGKSYNCVGDVRDVDIRTNVDNANSMSFTYHGRIVSES